MGLVLLLQVGGTRGSATTTSHLGLVLLPVATTEKQQLDEDDAGYYPLSWLLMLTLIAGASIPVLIYFLSKGCTRPTSLPSRVRRDQATQCSWKETDVVVIE